MKIAVIGCTGAVGREMLHELEHKLVEPFELVALASPRSEGIKLPFRGGYVSVKSFDLNALKECDYALMSAGGDFSRKWAKEIADRGTVVIDNSSAWRMERDVPLVVPEVNGKIIDSFKNGIIANPNCSTIQMVVSLKPLADHFGLEFINVSTYQSVSGSGQKGISELSEQVHNHLKFQDPKPSVYAQPIAFNIIPAIGPIGESGYCQEEEKLIFETRKIMNMPSLEILPAVARVPVFSCHSESITVRLSQEVTLEDVYKAFSSAVGLEFDSNETQETYPTPFYVAGRSEVFVSRVRLGFGAKKSKWLQFWNVADNLKKGAATNAVQIMKYLIDLRQ